MPKPEWCDKPSPCDFDVGSSYCPHRECRKNLIERHDNFLVKLRIIGENYTKRGLIKRLTTGIARMTSISHMQAQCPDCNTDLREKVHHLTIGDSEDVDDITCDCGAELEVELLAMFEVRKRDKL